MTRRVQILAFDGMEVRVDLALHVVAELAGEQARAATEAEMEWMWDRDQALLS